MKTLRLCRYIENIWIGMVINDLECVQFGLARIGSAQFSSIRLLENRIFEILLMLLLQSLMLLSVDIRLVMVVATLSAQNKCSIAYFVLPQTYTMYAC